VDVFSALCETHEKQPSLIRVADDDLAWLLLGMCSVFYCNGERVTEDALRFLERNAMFLRVK